MDVRGGDAAKGGESRLGSSNRWNGALRWERKNEGGEESRRWKRKILKKEKVVRRVGEGGGEGGEWRRRRRMETKKPLF